MADRTGSTSDLIRARRKRRRSAQGRVNERKELPKIQRAGRKRLPSGVRNRLRAKLLQTGREVDLGALTPDQVAVLDELRERYVSVQSRHGRHIEKFLDDKGYIDKTFPQDVKDFARTVRAAEKAGLLRDCRFTVPTIDGDTVELAQPALKAALGWLAMFDDDGRPKHRRLTPPEKAAPTRWLWAKFAKPIVKKTIELRKKEYSHERIRQAVIPMLRRISGEDAEDAAALADIIVGMTGRGWSKRLKSLCD